MGGFHEASVRLASALCQAGRFVPGPIPRRAPSRPAPPATPPSGPPTTATDGLAWFDAILGDGCSPVLLVLALHVIAKYLLPFARDPYRCLTRARLAGLGGFLALCTVEWIRCGPDWFPIVLRSALRAWLIASATGILLCGLEILQERVFNPLGDEFRRLLSLLCAPWRWLRDGFRARRYDRERAEERARIAARPVPRLPPPPTFESEANQLRQQYQRMVLAVQSLPLTDGEKEERVYHLQQMLGEKLNQLTERYWS